MKIAGYMAWGHRRGANHHMTSEEFLIWYMSPLGSLTTVCDRVLKHPEVALAGELLPNDTCKQCLKIVQENR